MNAINRIELAIRRAASQMPAGTATAFKLLADELSDVTHDGDQATEIMLKAWRDTQRPE